jgi:hypothetical protein
MKGWTTLAALRYLAFSLCFCILILAAGCSRARPAPGPVHRDRVQVKPVLLVPTDIARPDARYAPLLMRHLKWAQRRYAELLHNMDTFELAGDEPLVLAGRHDREYYLATNDGGAESAVLELFAHDGDNRSTCTYIYVVCFVGTGQWPAGGGRPINGGINTGGGILIIGADGLVTAPNFQSTLQHELGHCFGLPHVDVYGLDMATSESLMSYNPGHHTNFFEPSATPGRFIAEDYRALSYAKRVFPAFKLAPEHDYPPGYTPGPMVFLGPMQLTGQPDYAGPSIVQ